MGRLSKRLRCVNVSVALVLVGVSAPIALAACRRDSVSTPTGDTDGLPRVLVNGTGATFPAPLFERWIAAYANRFVQIPVAAGAVAATYNVARSTPMRLSADVLARIFLGQITRWDDPALAALNPDEPLPRAPIVVVTRADGSGTSAAFTEYLAKANPRFEAKVGTGLTVSFPVGLSALGNAGVTSQVRSTPNAVGDAELSFARDADVPCAAFENRRGAFVAPDVAAVRASLAAPASDGAYPVAALSYVVARHEQPDTRKALALVRFLAWVLRDGQALATPLGYAPLPDAPLQYARGALATLRSHGKPLTPGLAFD